MSNTETVRALINAFNLYNYGRNTVETNFKLQSRYGKDYIVVSFDKGMDRYQCSEYLDSIKRKIIREFYGIEEGDTGEVVLNTANLIFNIKSFPFNTSKGKWSQNEQGRIEFLTPIDKGVIFNLKSHLASSLEKDVLEDMQISSTTVPVNKGKYLCCSKFDNKELSQQFESKFLSRMRERYENVLKKPLEVKGNSVYIKDVFDDARFIDSVTRYVTWLEGMYLGVDSSTNHRVKLFKDMIVESIGESAGVTIYGFMCASPLNRKEASVLIPIMQNCRGARLLTKEEARDINRAFNYTVLNDLYGRTQAELSTNGSSEVYGIDFSNPEISHCVITKIIESSVINAKHELSIDPELRFRASTPVHNGPNSDLTGTSIQGLPTRSHDDGLEGSPRQGSGKKEETGGPSRVLPGEGIGQTSASSQQMNRWSLPSTSGNKWQLSPEPGPSGLSWNKSGSASTSAWPSSAPSVGPSLWPQSGSLSSKRPTSVYSADSGYSESLERPQPNSSITTSAVPGISESGEDLNAPVDNKRPQSLPLADFSTRASDKTVKAFLYFLDYFSSPEGKKQLPLLLSSKAEKQLSSISDPREQENLLDFLFSTEGNKQLCSLFSSENKQQLYSLFSLKGKELLFSPSPEGQKTVPLVLSPEGKERLPLLLSPEGEQISKPFSPEAGNIISLLIYSRVEPKNMSHRSFRDKLAKWLHRNSSLSKVASPQEKPLTDDEKKELRPFLRPELQKKLDSNSLENPQLIYLLYTPNGKKKLDLLLLSSPEKEGKQLHPDLFFKFSGDEQEISGNASTSSEESGIFSGSSSQGSVSSECKECSVQQVKYMSKALEKNLGF